MLIALLTFLIHSNGQMLMDVMMAWHVSVQLLHLSFMSCLHLLLWIPLWTCICLLLWHNATVDCVDCSGLPDVSSDFTNKLLYIQCLGFQYDSPIEEMYLHADGIPMWTEDCPLAYGHDQPLDVTHSPLACGHGQPLVAKYCLDF
jgi:hypothetical protein